MLDGDFVIPDEEIENYTKHGIASLKLSKMIPVPTSEIRVSLDKLYHGHRKPLVFWVDEVFGAPTIKIADRIDGERIPRQGVQELQDAQSLKILLYHEGPSERDYSEYDIELSY